MNKKIVIIIMIIAVILLGVGFVFIFKNKDNNKNTLDPDTYVAEEHIFQSPDEVVVFLKNIYNSDNVEIVENDGSIAKIKAVDGEGTVYNYEFDIDNHLLNSIDDENTIADEDNKVDETPAVVSE